MRYATNSIYTPSGSRKYLTNTERSAFLKVVEMLPPEERLFCLTLIYTGCRISEALQLTNDNLSRDEKAIVFRTLKKRNQIVMRCVPVPPKHMLALEKRAKQNDSRLFPWGRTRGWEIIKSAMTLAKMKGAKASPKGLRHTYGMRLAQNGVPLTTISSLLGHSDISTTAIYTNAVLATEIRDYAAKAW